MNEHQLKQISFKCRHSKKLLTHEDFMEKFLICFPDEKNINLKFSRTNFHFFKDILLSHFDIEMISWENISFDSILDIDYKLAKIKNFVFFINFYRDLVACYFNKDLYISNEFYYMYKSRIHDLWKKELEKEIDRLNSFDPLTWKEI